ncbi:MAG: hypothetical protein ABH834_08275 [Candidatus Altiarchaeota archaeon]
MAKQVVRSPANLTRELHTVVDEKFPPNLAPNMKHMFGRMRDCRYDERSIEVGALYLPAQATADDLEALETDFAQMGQGFVYQSIERGDPPKTPDSIESLQAKIQCARKLDVARIVGEN